MKPEQKAMQLSAAVLIGAILLRLLVGISDGTLPDFPKTQLAQTLLFLQTGRVARLDAEAPTEPAQPPTASPVTAPTEAPVPALVFTAGEAAQIQLRNQTSYEIPAEQLLMQPLSWDLTGTGPTVLILHTHGSESYAGTTGYRSSDPQRNMIAIGDRLAAFLEEAGISVLHDRTMYDAESYNGSYTQARQAITQHLAQHPSIRLVLDLHRDAAEDVNGNQINYTVTTPQGRAAKLMLVMGTDSGGLAHPNWQENMALALKLHLSLEKICPEICRPVYIRTSRFNQDLSPGALLVEVGAAGNTLDEALLATDILAQGIIALAHGANI